MVPSHGDCSVFKATQACACSPANVKAWYGCVSAQSEWVGSPYGCTASDQSNFVPTLQAVAEL